MDSARYLIVNADDFGRSAGVNKGAIEAFERGVVTSASLMVRWPAAAAAAAYSREHQDLSVGLHIDLAEWSYRDGSWIPTYEVVPTDDAVAVEEEANRQLDTFRRLVGRDPTHIDSHQHVHREEPVRSALIAIARRLAIPLRDCSTRIHFCGSFYGQTGEGLPLPDIITVAGLIAILAALPPGVTEVGCHPGLDCDLHSTYGSERIQEVAVLCDPQVRAAIVAMGIELRSFTNIAGDAGSPSI